MSKLRILLVACLGMTVLIAGMLASAQDKPSSGNLEREIREAEVPKPVLEALRRLADKAAITEFAEEIEHGQKFYEGSWAGASGHVDALVTDSGDLVEIEEVVPAELVPARVRAEAQRQAGKDAKIRYEKKTLILYEIHFDGGRELIFTPDGRTYHEEIDQDQVDDQEE